LIVTHDADISRLGSALIQAKLERPRLSDRLVSRPRLIEQLDTGSAARVTLLSAPAGYGKTTTALQWLERRGGNVAWVSLDVADRDPERFARYLVAALSEVSDTGFETCRALLEARIPPPWPYFCEILVAELDRLTENTVLVFEDYHLIDSPEIHNLVELIVERSPQAFHIAVITRVDPPWPLVRWRTQGWLNQLRARDLCFSAEETAAFFSSTTDLALSPTTVECLQHRTEGWIAGLRLAQLSLSESEDPDLAGRELSGTDRQIADYLIEEVLEVQPPEVIEFLSASALMERFTAPLMGHLLADQADAAEARRILTLLEKDNLFLIALDTRRQWYRWHHLFRDLLLDHLGHIVSPDFRDRVNRDAGAWFAREGDVEDALRYWLAAGELDAAAELVGAHLHRIIDEDMSRLVVRRWLGAFPPGAEDGRIPLLVAHGYVCITNWDLPRLERLLQDAERLLGEGEVPPAQRAKRRYQADVAAQRAFLHYWLDDPVRSVESASRALRLLGPRDRGLARQHAVLYKAAALAMSGQRAGGVRLLEQAAAEQHPGEEGQIGSYLMGTAFLHLYAADMLATRSCAQRMLATHETRRMPDFLLAHAQYLLGAVAYELDELEEAAASFRQVALMRHRTGSRLCQDALIGLALVAGAQGDTAAAASHAASARAYALEVGDPVSLLIADSFEARLALSTEDAPPVISAPARRDVMFPWLEVPSLTYAQVLLRNPSCETALPFIEEALARAEAHHNVRQAIPFLLLKAEALASLKRTAEALDVLAATVRRAGPLGLVRTFVDRGSETKQLLDELAMRAGSDDYLTSLRAAFDRVKPLKHPSIPVTARASDALTYRELETLELLAWRMTNKEIADRLTVSSAAVKKRLESIYAKLGVNDRRAAVADAVARGLIDAPTR